MNYEVEVVTDRISLAFIRCKEIYFHKNFKPSSICKLMGRNNFDLYLKKATYSLLYFGNFSTNGKDIYQNNIFSFLCALAQFPVSLTTLVMGQYDGCHIEIFHESAGSHKSQFEKL